MKDLKSSPQGVRHEVKASHEVYNSWIVQDQSLFTWLLSTTLEFVLPRILQFKHAYKVCDKVQKHFNSHIKACVH